MVDLAPGPGLLRSPRRFPMFVVALGTLVASACNSNSVDVQGDDNNVIIPTFRATLAIFPENQRSIAETLRRKKMFRPAAPDQNVAPEDTVASVDPEVEPPLEPIEGTLAIDFGFAFGKSDTAQQVGAGQLLSLNGTTFFGPTDVAADFALYSWTVAARGGVRIREILSLEGLGGLGIQSYDLESGGGTVHDSKVSGGPLIGGRATLHLIPWVDIYTQTHATFGVGYEAGTLASYEAGATISPLPGLALLAGWRWWNFDEDRDGEGDVEIKLSGPMVGAVVTF